MLRTILGKGRAVLMPSDDSVSSTSAPTEESEQHDVLESYIDWIQRVTHEVEEASTLAGIPDW
eukprot:10858342-Karenia_brevis.AAC.1